VESSLDGRLALYITRGRKKSVRVRFFSAICPDVEKDVSPESRYDTPG
jgi:hypothetical protein